MALFHNYPYTNFHDLNLDWIIEIVKELKAIVDQIDVDEINRRFSNIESILATHTADIELLKSQSTAAAAAINTLQTTVSGIQVDIAQIHSQIDGVIDQIAAAVTELTGDVSALQSELDTYRTATDSRLSQLEDAAFGQLVLSPLPYNFLMDMRNGLSKGITIVQDDSSQTANSIQWVTGGTQTDTATNKEKLTGTFQIPRFYKSGNQCHLVIPSVLPYRYKMNVDENIYFYAQRYMGAQSINTGIAYIPVTTMGALLADGGVQNTSSLQHGPLLDLELVVNQETGDYDLYIYNGRNGRYAYINDYMFTCLMISNIDIRPQATGATLRFYELKTTLFNQFYKGLNADGKIAVAKSQIEDDITYETDKALKASAVMESMNFDEDVSVVTSVNRNNSMFSIERVADRLNMSYDYTVTRLYIDMTIVLENFTSNTDTTLGQFLRGALPTITLGKTALVNVSAAFGSQIEHSYGSVSTTGELVINVKGASLPSTGTVRITGYIYDVVDNNLP